ncbi:MAG: ribonuclease III [Halobacteriovoraceae bacterium]|nr:ribonuclease III [Halobacteriovoraceae bacterium]|tara:strand:- start:11668 stop:12420 length:753 start_codon:yes stop_codon:yes gene_type:complete
MQITQKIQTEFLPFHRNFSSKELAGFVWDILPKSLHLDLILEALTHRSFSHESKSNLADNERLEFLGDSILQLIITEELFKRHKGVNEGKLSKLRSHLVNENTLCLLAQNLELHKYILLGNGELKGQGQSKPSILANTFEAILGAIYLEKGLDESRKFILVQYKALEKNQGQDFFSLESMLEFDAKSRLQELSQKVFGELPEYKSRELKDGQFEVQCLLGGKLQAKKVGPSKKQLMQDLAKQIIEEQKLS